MRTMLVLATLMLLLSACDSERKEPKLPPIKASELAGELERNPIVILQGDKGWLRCTKGGGGPTCVPCGKNADCQPGGGGGTGTGTGTGGKGGVKVGKLVIDVDTINCPCESCGSGCSGPCAIVCATDNGD